MAINRRTFGLASAYSFVAATVGLSWPKAARASVSADKAALLKTTLTPFGAERAGNANGSIPPWTGGLTKPPAGWTADQPIPDLFASDALVVKIDAGNMEHYKDRLADGVMLMMKKYGFSIHVYPTHRTAAAPQWVYDNAYKNALNAQTVDGGGRFGFKGAYGGPAFPIPNQQDPEAAGVEIIWNHLTRWVGEFYTWDAAFYVMENGNLTLTSEYKLSISYDYYQKSGNAQTYDGYYHKEYLYGLAPSGIQGSELVVWDPTNPSAQQQAGWQYLNGQGRVRKIPQEQYDVPEAEVDGIINYDEANVFYGSPDRFDWKFIEKKEMYIPYNCNKAVFATREDYGPRFINPEIVRWELHRVWVVEAKLHPGDRDVVPRRVFYLDEDTWIAVLADEYDAHGNFWLLNNYLVVNRPDVPSTFAWSYVEYNLQKDTYVQQFGFPFDAAKAKRTFDFTNAPNMNVFNPQTMSARAQY